MEAVLQDNWPDDGGALEELAAINNHNQQVKSARLGDVSPPIDRSR
jgi:hypothetical protein